MRRATTAIGGIAALATLALLAAALLQAPGANGPAEWRWEYRTPGPPGLAGGWAPAGFALALLAIYFFWDRRASSSGLSSRPSALWLALAVLAGWGLTLSICAAEPGGFGRVLASLASRLSFSYVYDAGLAPPTRELLADYPAASARLDLHARTHPPGPILAVRGVDALTRALPLPPPGAGRGLVAAARDALQREIARARDRHRPAPAEPPGPWTLVVLAFLLPALSALAAWPLARLAAAWGLGAGGARLAVLLWLAVPARSLFTPSLDQALPLLAVGALVLAAAGGRARPPRAFAAGLLLFAAAFLSYGCLALLPWAAAVALTAGGEESGDPNGTPRRRLDLARPLALGLGFLLPWLALVPLGYAPWTAFRYGILTHRTMAVVARGYLTWLAWNPYDFALLLGPIVLVLGLAALAAVAAGAARAGRPLAYRVGIAGFWALLALLWISGSVRGEVGRIWLLFMPFACLFAADAVATGIDPPARRSWGAGLAALELALTLALAASMVFVA